ncbi:hypothetical protein LOTGIDRAFT_153873 [Lottia gigantea]|uniref:NAD-dependent epimerase/dehydratase domain-containing protein n=1 Tax=Lottia gigantea TaxID=225164 RepID=V4A8R6_LOTGI|nr:hypothetical protein LOTGIDRAFT_153873 [Lottia gigantea]ESO91430.1 hypothetical protein LOTGIDRAFT_153873 [Lottia gigantea]
MFSDSVVLVTGASGFIASHIVKLLQEEDFRVRGTVRSLTNEDKLKRLNSLCPHAKHKLELLEADLLMPKTWESAVKDVEFVIHVASPSPDDDGGDIIKVAVDGTINVLKACANANTVKRIVLTSSCMAVFMVNRPSEVIRKEDDWSDPSELEPYSRSKTLAEKAAWDFVKELPADKKIELAVINPAFVIGPVLHGSNGTSQELIKRLLERSIPAVPNCNITIVDVRDVALAHVRAMKLSEAAGMRHIVATANVSFPTIAQILKKEFLPQGYYVPTMVAPYFILWFASWFDKVIKLILPQVGRDYQFDDTRMKNVLEISPRSISESVIDMAYSMIESGLVFKSDKYHGPPRAAK